MFYALSHCCAQPRVAFGEPKENAVTNTVGKALDIISGIALIVIGALMASGVMTGSPAAAYAMLAVGGLQLGRHLFPDSCCTAMGNSAKERMARRNDYEPVDDYTQGSSNVYTQGSSNVPSGANYTKGQSAFPTLSDST
jgi:hypothetical protein